MIRRLFPALASCPVVRSPGLAVGAVMCLLVCGCAGASVRHTAAAPLSTASTQPVPASETRQTPTDLVAARLLAIADSRATTYQGTAAHVAAVLTTRTVADAVLDSGTSAPVDTARVWLVDISGPTRYVCDTCFSVTAAPTGSHAQLIIDATTYGPVGTAIDDEPPDLARAGRVLTLR
ncbi:hypothetical protein ACXR2U_13150 [Jatrophihabitans sp. YIM 134969]